MTWAEVARTCGSTARTVLDKGVYAGGPEVVLEALRVVPAEARTAIFIGHNPTSAYLCHLLDDGEGAPEAISGMQSGGTKPNTSWMRWRIGISGPSSVRNSAIAA